MVNIDDMSVESIEKVLERRKESESKKVLETDKYLCGQGEWASVGNLGEAWTIVQEVTFSEHSSRPYNGLNRIFVAKNSMGTHFLVKREI